MIVATSSSLIPTDAGAEQLGHFNWHSTIMSAMEEKSQRTPQLSTQFNDADNIERYLRDDSHRTWGFVIYRCTYESNEEWDEFMARLRFRIQDWLRHCNGLDMMDKLDLTVIEDRSLLDDASTSVVREHFKKWATTAPQEEQGTGPGKSQRYRYCIQVDAEVLESIVHDAKAPPAPDPDSEGYVNLIWKDWEPYGPGSRESEEPIEGCTEHDVGWIMVVYSDVVGMYYHLRDPDAWDHEYRRPPIVTHS
jgi:hypothetical protein